MSKSHTVSLDIMRAVQQIGPSVTNTQLANAGGVVCKHSYDTVKGRLGYLVREGYLRREGKGATRKLTVTPEGLALLEDPDNALWNPWGYSKPEPVHQGEPKKRKCLDCRRTFKSSWPGHRICNSCKSNAPWQSPAAAQFVTQEVS